MFRNSRFYKGLWSRWTALRFGEVEYDSDSASGIILQSELVLVQGLKECSSCGLFQAVPDLRPGQVAECKRCGSMLERVRRTSPIMAPLAFCLASIALYLALLVSPLMTIDVYGRENTVTIRSGPHELVDQGFGLIAILVNLATILMPAVVLGFMLFILYGASSHKAPSLVRDVLAWYEKLRPWSMIEVYVIGLIVAYTKLVDLAVVKLLPGSFILFALMITMAAMDSTFNSELFWHKFPPSDREPPRLYEKDFRTEDYIVSELPRNQLLSCMYCQSVFLADHPVPNGADMGNCPVCDQTLRRRKQRSAMAAASYLLAASVFYIPANLLPIMTYVKMGQGQPSTILSGVKQLWHANLYVLALIVLFASITFPVLKIVALSTMLCCEALRKDWNLRFLSRLYGFVCFIGRWSMIDVFMISILAAIVRFSFFAHVSADSGVVFFASVVVLTIFAADVYDPRGMWDAAGYNCTLTQSEKNSPDKVLVMRGKQVESERT
ncbi:paraquat-inducible protein A [Acetobacteraceae bacterium ESL0709]|nr:paraquat-inducible protein A [Acetobacteraceae bacterium ESL0697]MDF7677253.1 paraquat-inducible protein A [Acetobacteraceae bacterium ESL0709]